MSVCAQFYLFPGEDSSYLRCCHHKGTFLVRFAPKKQKNKTFFFFTHYSLLMILHHISEKSKTELNNVDSKNWTQHPRMQCSCMTEEIQLIDCTDDGVRDGQK